MTNRYTFLYVADCAKPIYFFYDGHSALLRWHHKEMTITVLQKWFFGSVKSTGCNSLGILFLLYLFVHRGCDLQSLKCQLQSRILELITQSNLLSSNIEGNKNKLDLCIRLVKRPIYQTQLRHHTIRAKKKFELLRVDCIIVSYVV